MKKLLKKTTMIFGQAFSNATIKDLRIYDHEQILEIMEKIRDNIPIVRKNKYTKYVNIPIAFDIETSSFYINDIKYSCMYLWSFCIYDYTIIGRTWSDFKRMLYKIIKHLKLNHDEYLCIYVHNFSYEFQFMRKWFKWNKVFAMDKRKPLFCVTDNIEFRCSYLLSGYSLENLPLHKYKIDKLVGYLNYDLIRSDMTELTDEEILYSAFDSIKTSAYITEKISGRDNIATIPLTKTSYVRRACRRNCFGYKNPSKYNEYHKIIKNLIITDNTEYDMLKKAFAGGFTHSNAFKTNRVIDDVESQDLTSSYPAAACSELFPMSKGEKILISNKDYLPDLLSKYCVLMDVRIKGLEPKIFCDQPLSSSRCRHLINPTILNGRILRADSLETTITEQDLKTILDFYDIKNLDIGLCIRYKKDYLPKDIILSILKFYGDKTMLKGVDGKEIDYLQGKENCNSIYGMMVTSIIKEVIKYENEDGWIESDKIDIKKELNKYNTNNNRFLYYPWGVWITAYARRNLFMLIKELNDDYCYSDTDAAYGENMDNHRNFIKKYNDNIIKKLYKMCDKYNIDHTMIKPKNIYGEECYLGVWGLDKKYKKFKTLGAKRYLGEDDKGFKLTVAGLGKQKGCDYICNNFKGEEFNFFSDGMHIPPENTGKLTLTYYDDVKYGFAYDYKGNKFFFRELSGIHMEKQSYDLSCQEYIDAILGLTEV